MTDPNPDFDRDEVDEVEQANVAAAAIAGFTLAQLAFGALIKNGILPKDHAEHLLRHAIEMRLLVLEIEEQPNCWPPLCKAFPPFNPQLGNRASA
jgi:hypothetical protein